MQRLWLFGIVITFALGVAAVGSGCYDEQPLSTTTTRETTTTAPIVEAPPPSSTRQTTTTTTYGSPVGSVTRERTTYTNP
jgi:hypothetical protein